MVNNMPEFTVQLLEWRSTYKGTNYLQPSALRIFQVSSDMHIKK